MTEQIVRGLSTAASQLIEAACRAREGDREAARAYIAHATALLNGQLSLPPVAGPANVKAPVAKRTALAPWQARQLAAYIDAHLAERIPIDDLAGLTGISKSHFCRAFKLTFGVTAKTWVMRRRVELAQTLMLTTNALLCDIALSCGMSDQSHFTRTFRRVLGQAPCTWRRSRLDAARDRFEGALGIREGATA